MHVVCLSLAGAETGQQNCGCSLLFTKIHHEKVGVVYNYMLHLKCINRPRHRPASIRYNVIVHVTMYNVF